MPVPSQGHYGFHSFPVFDWFCLFIYLRVLTFPSVILLLPLFTINCGFIVIFLLKHLNYSRHPTYMYDDRHMQITNYHWLIGIFDDFQFISRVNTFQTIFNRNIPDSMLRVWYYFLNLNSVFWLDKVETWMFCDV
jgi:hypothetical protein